MRQTLHIFKKDVRHLRVEITIVLLAMALFAGVGASRAHWLTGSAQSRNMAWEMLMVLLPLSWWALIARAIHDEVIPGDRQFWITRPYLWKSLLGAKVLFIFVFVNVPLLLADIIIVSAHGFGFGSMLPGLIWTQVLLSVVLVLPVAAIAAITTGLVQLMLAVLILFVFNLAWNVASPVTGLNSIWFALDWVKGYYAYLVILVAGVVILLRQYSVRRTTSARIVAGAAVIAIVFGAALIPWTAAFALQSHLSKIEIAPSAVHVAFDAEKKWAARALIGPEDRVHLILPLAVSGVPEGMTIKPDGLIATIQAPGGVTWRAHKEPWAYVASNGQLISLQSTVDGRFYRRIKNTPVEIRGTLYLTLFGGRKVTSVSLDNRFEAVPGVGVCSASQASGGRNCFLVCSSAFRSEPGQVDVQFNFRFRGGVASGGSSPALSFSYSPFPASLSIDPISQFTRHTVPFGPPVQSVVVTAVEPVAHIERHFEISSLRLGDFEVRLNPLQ